MMNKKEKFVFFITSYTPMWIIFLIKFLPDSKNFGLCFKIIVILSLSIFIFWNICKLTKLLNPKGCASAPIDIIRVKNISIDYITNYFSLYLFPFFALEIENFTNIVILGIILILSAYLYTKNNIIYVNPVLNFLGYSIYEVEIKLNGDNQNSMQTSYLITKREKYDVIKKISKIYKFEDNIYFEKKEDIEKNNIDEI